MKLRLMGTKEEVQELLEVLPIILDMKEVSEEYPNRGNSSMVRVYVDATKAYMTNPVLDIYNKISEFKDQIETAIILFDAGKNNAKLVVSDNAISALAMLFFIKTEGIQDIIDSLEKPIIEKYGQINFDMLMQQMEEEFSSNGKLPIN